MVGLVLTACGSWRGIANVPIPGGTGTGADHMTIYCADARYVGALRQQPGAGRRCRASARSRAIELKNWIATLTLDIDPSVKLPKNATAKIGQTSLLGSQHVELASPPNPSPELLKNGDTIPLKNAAAFPTTERVLAAISMITRGGGIPNLEVIQNEIYNIVTGREDQIREFLGKLDTFTDQLNHQRNDLTRAIDSSNRLLSIVAQRNDTLDQVLTEFPPLIKHFADTKDLFADAVVALGRLGTAADNALAPASPNLHTNLAVAAAGAAGAG